MEEKVCGEGTRDKHLVLTADLRYPTTPRGGSELAGGELKLKFRDLNRTCKLGCQQCLGCATSGLALIVRGMERKEETWKLSAAP